MFCDKAVFSFGSISNFKLLIETNFFSYGVNNIINYKLENYEIVRALRKESSS
jgi:hypothetical protein